MEDEAKKQANGEANGAIETRAANGRFLPGHSVGRPKNSSNKPRALLKKALDAIGRTEAFLDEHGNPVSFDDAILTKLASLAVTGDMQAIQIWMAYRFGRPVPMEAEKGDQGGLQAYLRKLEAQNAKTFWNPAHGATDVTDNAEGQNNGAAQVEKDRGNE